MYRHIWAEIDLNALEYNIDNILKLVSKEKIMGVVKANAYGHGAGAVTKLLTSKGISSFAVSNAYEAIDLRHSGVEGEILILGNIDVLAVKELAEQNISICLFDTNSAARLSKSAVDSNVDLNCHIKLDTGMGRLGLNCRNGFNQDEFKKDIEQIFSLPNLHICGAFTHFATADRDGDENGEFTKKQHSRFETGCKIINSVAEQYGIKALCFHSFNSAATLLNNTSLQSDRYRAGIILYGLTPSMGLTLPFSPKPVMTLKAMIAQVKTIKSGDTVSYGRTFTAKKEMRVATVTAGYADGYMRGLSNKGYMLIDGKKAPIIGRVCMDQTVVDVTDIPNAKSGDTAILFGEGLPVEVLADKLKTINYELVCAVAHRVPRVYKRNGKIIDTIRYHSI